MTEAAHEIEHSTEVAVHEEQQPVPLQSDTAVIFGIIERAARDPNVDLDKMERLMAMRDAEMNRATKHAYNVAMRNAQAAMPQVVREAENAHTKSTYARYEHISAAMQPVIDEHGFSLSFGTEQSPVDGCIRIVCDVAHSDGFEKRFHLDLPLDAAGAQGKANKNPTQAVGSTLSYGRRYLKTLIFDVAVKNQDDDGNSAGDDDELISEEQVKTIRRLIEETNSDTEKFCVVGKIGSIPEMKARNFQSAVQVLEEKKRRMAK